MRKEYFKNMLGNPPKITEKPITKIINCQLDIKIGQFTQNKINVVLSKIKIRKATSFDEIPAEVCKTRKFDDLLVKYCNDVYNQNTIDSWTKSCILPFLKGMLELPRTTEAKLLLPLHLRFKTLCRT